MTTHPDFTEADHLTWKKLFQQLAVSRDTQVTPEFTSGLKDLAIDDTKIPDLDLVNFRLSQISGWQGVYTSGLVEASDFFKMLSERKFPIGNFIRDAKDLSYTPEPDVFHDLYGHIPFLSIPEYAQFCQKFGEAALTCSGAVGATEEFQRLFWFTIEFGLIETNLGRRAFGAGIASSLSECQYSLSERPQIRRFCLEEIRNTNFRIDKIQEKLFLLDSKKQLFDCLDEFAMKFSKEVLC